VRYFTGQFVARGAVYLYSIGISKFLSKEAFVQFTLFLLAANIFSRICNYSLNMLLTKFRYGDAADAAKAQEALYEFMLVLAIALTAIFSLVNATTPIATFLGFSPILLEAVLISGCLQAIENGSIEVFQSNFQSTRYLSYMVFFTGILLALSGLSYFLVGFDNTLVPIAAYLIAQFGVLLFFGRFQFGRLADRAQIKRYFILATPLFFYALATYFNRYIDLFILNKLDQPDNIANFAFISRMTEVLSLVILACAAVLTPLTFQILKKKTMEQGERRSISLLISAQTGIFFAYYLTVKLVTRFWFPEYLQSLEILPWLVFAMFLNLLVGWLQVFLLAFDYMSYMLFANVILAALGFGLDFWLIPRYSVEGAAIARNVIAILLVMAYGWKARSAGFGWTDFRMKWIVAGNAAALLLGFSLF